MINHHLINNPTTVGSEVNFPADTDQLDAAANEARERIGAELASLIIGPLRSKGVDSLLPHLKP